MAIYDFKIVIDRNGAVTFQGDAEGFEIQSFCVGLATRCHQHNIGFHTFLLPFLVSKIDCAVDNTLDAALHVESDAMFLHQFSQALGDVAIDSGQTFLQEFHNRYFRTEAVEDTGEFHPDDSSSNDT